MSYATMFRRQPVRTLQQNKAIENHCRLGFETSHPRFAYVRRNVTIVLSVNSGFE